MEVFISKGVGILPLIIGFFIFSSWNVNTNLLVAGQLNNDTSVSTQLCKDTVLYGALSWELHALCCQQFYGSSEECDFVCPCVNGARDCNVTSRTCECRDGYKGPFCQISCKHNKRFGRQCTNRCLCGPDAFCDPVTGVCVCTISEGCKRCKVGRWGQKCNFPCECGKGYSCNDDTGECICRNETFCDQADLSTETSCHCQNGGTCTSFSDQCNCREGWTGRDCSEPCPAGFYGAACQLRCQCGQGANCHPQTGFCLCPDLTKGYKCANRCPEGRFGPKCAYDCYCPEGLTCNQITGNCACLGGALSCINSHTVTTKAPKFSGINFNNRTTVEQYLPDMPPVTGPPMASTEEKSALISDYLLWIAVGIVAVLIVIAIFLLVLIAFKRKKVNDVDCRKGMERADTNDYEDVEEMNFRRDTLPPSFELPPIPTTSLGPISPKVSLPPLPTKPTQGDPMVPRRVKSLMSTSRKRQKQPQMRNSFHAQTPSMFSSLSTISTRSTETLTPLPKSIQNLGVTNEMLANESAYEATIKSHLRESRWSSLPSVPVQNGSTGPRGASLTDSENVRMSLVVADCDEYEDYADPFTVEDQKDRSSSTKEEFDNLLNEKKTMGQIQSNPLYNGRLVDRNGLQRQTSSPNLMKKASKGAHDSPREQLNSRLKKSASSVDPRYRLTHSMSTRSFNESLHETKRYSSPVLARKDSEEDDYADPSDSVASPRARAHSDMRKSCNDSNSALSDVDGGPTYFTLENSSNKSTPNSSRPQSAIITAGEDSDYDELEEEPIEPSVGKSQWNEKPSADDHRKMQRNRMTFGGKTASHEDPQYFVLERSRSAYSERTKNNNDRKNAFRAPLRATEEDGDYSHLERMSFDNGDIVVSDLQNDDYASLRT